MTYSKNWLDIANRALVKTGNQQIESFTGGTDNVKIVNALLPEAVEAVASLFPWRALTQRKALAALDQAPDFGYTYQYALPTNFARVVSVETDGSDWVRESGVILTNSGFVNLVYLKLPEEPIELTPQIKELIVLRLACNIVQTTTSNTTLYQLLYKEFSEAVILAEREDTQGEPDIIDYKGWETAR